MSAGLPVVASEIGIIGRVISQNSCGLLVPADDAIAHADAILTLLEDKDRAEQLGRAGRGAVVSTYNWESQAAHLLILYKEVLSESA